MKTAHEFMVILALTILFMFGNWLLDVGNAIVASSLQTAWLFGYYVEPMLGNGFWVFSATATFHFGWYLSLASYFILAFFCVHLIGKYKACNEKAHSSKAG